MMSKWAKGKESGRVKLLFGKYNGQFLDCIPSSYLIFMIKEHVGNGGFDEDLIVEAEQELKSRGEDLPEC